MADFVIAKLRQRAADPALARDVAAEFPGVAAPPLARRAVTSAEAALGRPLPPLLRELYLSVGDGGFGPGYGLLPLLPRDMPPHIDSIVSIHTALAAIDPDDPTWSWPAHYLPFCEWGDAIRSCIDCASPEGAILTFDPGARDVGQDMSEAFALTHSSLRAWLSDWLAGVKIWDLMFEPDPSRARTGVNPFTKEPITLVPNKLRRL